MSKKTTRRFVNSEKIKLRRKQLLPEPADEMTADVACYGSNSKDPLALSYTALSLPVNIHQGNASDPKQEDSDKSASPDDPFKDYYKKLQDLDLFDTDSSSWDQSATSFMSWSDEVELVATEKVQKLMDDVECILYDEPVETMPSKEIIEECRLWKEAFPHMRVRGNAVKMDVMPQEREHNGSNNEEEIFAIDGVFNSADEDTSAKEQGSLTDSSCALHPEEIKSDESFQLENMVKKYVVQQLASYVWSEVKKLTSDVQSGRECASRNSSPLADVCAENSVCSRNLTCVSSDSESELQSIQTVVSKPLHTTKEICSSSSKPEFLVRSSNTCSSPSLFDIKNYSAEYPSFSVIGSAPVSLPPPRTANSSVHEARFFHSAAERSKRQYADRRFSFGLRAQDRSSDQYCGAAEEIHGLRSAHHSNWHGRQCLASHSERKINKRLVLPPINKIESQKMSAVHRPSRALSVNGIGFSRTEMAQEGVAQKPIEKSLDKKRNEQKFWKASYH